MTPGFQGIINHHIYLKLFQEKYFVFSQSHDFDAVMMVLIGYNEDMTTLYILEYFIS